MERKLASDIVAELTEYFSMCGLGDLAHYHNMIFTTSPPITEEEIDDDTDTQYKG